MFSLPLIPGWKRQKQARKRVDVVKEQVKKILTEEHQKLILMVRG